MQKMTPIHAREWMQHRWHSRLQMRALLNTYPEQTWHGSFNTKQSFSMQNGPPKPTDIAAKGHKPRGMHNAHFEAQENNSSKYERDDECRHTSMDYGL